MADDSFVWHKPSSFKERFYGFFNWLFHLPKIILIIIAIVITLLVVNIVLFTKTYLVFQKEQPSIVATVGDRKITKEQFLEQVKREEGFLKVASPSASKSEIQNTAKEKLILRAILETEAKNRGIAVTEEEINKEIQLRVEEAGGRENIDKTLKSYGWSEKDFRQIVYNDLLEKKLKNEIEGWSDIEGVLFWFKPEAGEHQKVQEIAGWLKDQFEAGKNLSQVFSELEEKTKGQFAINRLEQKIIHSRSDTWYPGLLKFILTTERGKVGIFDSGSMLISVIYVRDKHNGPDWETWLKEKNKKVSDSSVDSVLTFIFKSANKFLWPQVVEAADLCSPPYLCESSTVNCPDSYGCYQGPENGGVCSTDQPYLCIPSLAQVYVNVRDPLGNLVSADIVKGYNNAICFNRNTGVPQISGYYLIRDLNCCSGGPTTIQCSKSGYNDGYVSIPQGSLVNGGAVAVSCRLQPIAPPPTPTPSPSSSPSPSPSSSASPSPSPSPSPTPSPSPSSAPVDSPCCSCASRGGGCPNGQTRCYSDTGTDMGCQPQYQCFLRTSGSNSTCTWDPTNCNDSSACGGDVQPIPPPRVGVCLEVTKTRPTNLNSHNLWQCDEQWAKRLDEQTPLSLSSGENFYAHLFFRPTIDLSSGAQAQIFFNEAEITPGLKDVIRYCWNPRPQPSDPAEGTTRFWLPNITNPFAGGGVISGGTCRNPASWGGINNLYPCMFANASWNQDKPFICNDGSTNQYNDGWGAMGQSTSNLGYVWPPPGGTNDAPQRTLFSSTTCNGTICGEGGNFRGDGSAYHVVIPLQVKTNLSATTLVQLRGAVFDNKYVLGTGYLRPANETNPTTCSSFGANWMERRYINGWGWGYGWPPPTGNIPPFGACHNWGAYENFYFFSNFFKINVVPPPPPIGPWIQVTGDVHSNGRINAPGGP